MSISVNGQSQVPPGFRFHPTEEELLQYYLKKKVSNEMIDLDVIRDIDLNKLEPWDIQEMCKIGSTPQNDWYLFSHKDKKYPTGTRTNRATYAGFWKATGRDKPIYSNCKRIGMRKTLVFYKGRAPQGRKSDWIMHEYRLDDNTNDINNVSMVIMGGDVSQEEGWVVCRIFKKKNHQKTLDSPKLSSSSITFSEGSALEQILDYMGSTSTTCKEENDHDHNHSVIINFNSTTSTFLHQPGNIHTNSGIIINSDFQERFLKLPSLESPINSTSSQNCHQVLNNNSNNIGSTEMVNSDYNNNQVSCKDQLNSVEIYNNQMAETCTSSGMITNWAALDRLVASQLNCQTEASRQLACFNDPTINMDGGDDDDDDDDDHDEEKLQQIHQNRLITPSSSSSNSISISNKSYPANQDHYNSEIDLWSFARSSSPNMSSSDPLLHVSNSSR